jgi:glycosidase
METEILFQAFKWDATRNGRIGDWWAYLESDVLRDLSAAKFTHLWLPPASKERSQDFMGYTPMDYYDLGEHQQWIQTWDKVEKKLVWSQHGAESSLGSKYRGTETLWGHRSELDSLLRACHAQGMKCIADIVINHRAPQQVNGQDEWISWGSNEHVIASEKMVWGWKGRQDDPSEIAYKNGGVGDDDGEEGFGVNIAHHSASARNDIKQWLKWMRSVGFDGWRYDFVKGFGPEHVAEYNFHTGNPFSIGECRDTNAQRIYDWIDGTDAHDPAKKSMAFDFPLQNHLRDVFWGTRPFHELGLWKYASTSIAGGWPEKAVTFVTNHDLAREAFRGDFPTDEKRLIQGHVFLLTHPGLPSVFFSDFLERGKACKDAIRDLCLLRHELRITRTSSAQVVRSGPACYAALIDGHVIVKIGDEFWKPGGPAWKLRMAGQGWAVWALSGDGSSSRNDGWI